MSFQFRVAKGVSALSTCILRDVLHKNARNMPGKLALYIDPKLIAHLRHKIKHSIVVVGTNGKTTANNLIADIVERSGKKVICNRDGANLDSGVATALLQNEAADWGVFESDELWLSKTLPHLQSDYVLLLNLFRDQLDRCGEIDYIQQVIIESLKQSPCSVLVYNADDPQCAFIAKNIPNKSIAVGIQEDLHLAQNTVADAQMCQCCESIMNYHWKQYGQLGNYWCPTCHFKRPDLDYSVQQVDISQEESSFSLAGPDDTWKLHDTVGAAYMVYNLAAVATVAQLIGCSCEDTQKAISAFKPNNGRLQKFTIHGHKILLNLAKNPTGFNQNLKLVTQGEDCCAVVFFINDKEGDGHDISWLWDVDFEDLAERENVRVYAGGIRAADMQVRLLYAGIKADIVSSAEEVFAKLQKQECADQAQVYMIANYTALPIVKAQLEGMSEDAPLSSTTPTRGNSTADSRDKAAATQAAAQQSATSQAAASQAPSQSAPSQSAPSRVATPQSAPLRVKTSRVTAQQQSSASQQQAVPQQHSTSQQSPVVIAHLYPELLNLYGDGGNVVVLMRRLQWRGIPVEVRDISYDDAVDFSAVDLVFLGGGPDREQRRASENLMSIKNDLCNYVEGGGPLLAICGGYQLLGKTWLLGDDVIPGLGILDIRTERAPGGSTNRLIGDIALKSTRASRPLIGFENHAGRTYLGPSVKALGRVINGAAHGNNDNSREDGVMYKHLIGTYLHGPLLSKNPELADYILQAACDRRAQRCGEDKIQLSPLDNSVEIQANEYMAKRLHVL